MTDLFAQLGLRRLINVSGTETPLGSAPVCPEVVAAVTALVPFSVDMSELQAAASATIARAIGVEAGCVTGCTAASIAIAVAATMTHCDLARVEQLPDTTGLKNEVILQKGHEVTYGQNVSQNVRLAGARVIEIGAATQCGAYQLEGAITSNTAAALFVVSHLTVQERMISLQTFVELCHRKDVPVIVDAASVTDPRPYVATGADLVLFSAHKAFDGLTAGVVAGRGRLVQACLYQAHGIGRPMKAGKEGVVGAIAALDRWMSKDNNGQLAEFEARLQRARDALSGLRGIEVDREKNQLRIRVDAEVAGISAYELAYALRAGTPSIAVWSQFAERGVLLVSLAKVSDETVEHVCSRIRSICTSTNSVQRFDHAPNIADEVADRLRTWPVMEAGHR